MSISEERIRSIAETFRRARKACVSMDGFPGEIPSDLPSAYRVQDFAIETWGDRVAGWKIGGIAPALRPQFDGIDRLSGPVFSKLVVELGARPQPFPVFVGGFAAVEAEIVLRIGKDVAPGDCPPTVDAAAGIVDAAFLGVETAGSPLATINELGPRVIVSDFGNNHGLYVGPRIEDWQAESFLERSVTTWIDEQVVGTGKPGNLGNGPLGSVAFLIGNLAARGLVLSKGDLITTGAMTGVHSIAAGSRSRIEMTGLPVIELIAEPASAN